MKLALEHARKSGAAHKALITFTFNRVSQRLYMRHGLFPRMPIYLFDAARERLMEGLPEPSLRSIPIDDSAATMERLAEIDSHAIGVPARFMRKRAVPGGRTRYAHHVPDAADGIARVWHLDAISTAQSGLYVMASVVGSRPIAKARDGINI